MTGTTGQPFSQMTAGTSSQLLVPASEYRAGLFIAAPNGGRITVMPGAQAVLDSGFTIQPGDPPFYFSESDFG